MPHYHRLTDKDREDISRGLSAGKSLASIARGLSRPTSTVSREVRLHGGPMQYRAHHATERARSNASSRKKGYRKLLRNWRLRTYVLAHLRRHWSPDQIAHALTKRYPFDMTMRVAPETIYEYLYVLPRGQLRRELLQALRRQQKYRRPRKLPGTVERRGKLADMLSIEERPVEVTDRTVPGHWEGDLIVGKRKQSALGTLVERTTRFTLLVPLVTKDATSVRTAYANAIRTLPAELRKSLTYDQGKEMSEHRTFTLTTGMRVYFAHPASPWERGTNENTNGLIRQYYPKGTDFRLLSSHEVKRVQRELNARPRRTLDYATPQEAMNQLLR